MDYCGYGSDDEEQLCADGVSQMNIIDALRDNDDKKAYALCKEICAESKKSDKYYSRFEEFAGLISDKKSYVRTRGFSLCCAQAKWDKDGKLKEAMPVMLDLIHDEKPTVVRQCLIALHEVVLYRPELTDEISTKIRIIDLSKYKDSMTPLIRKDMDELMKMMK